MEVQRQGQILSHRESWRWDRAAARLVPFTSREYAACARKHRSRGGVWQGRKKKPQNQRGNLYLATGSGETPRSCGAWPCHCPHAEPCCCCASAETFPRLFHSFPHRVSLRGDVLPVRRRCRPRCGSLRRAGGREHSPQPGAGSCPGYLRWVCPLPVAAPRAQRLRLRCCLR